MQFNNETDLMNYFQMMHNFIRNRFGIRDKAALQFFNFFFVLKVIEPLIDSEELELSPICKYSSLVAIENDEEKLNIIKEMRKEIHQTEHVDTIFMQFPTANFDTQKKTLTEFLKLLDVLTPDILERFHVFGRIYEYFIGRNTGSRSGLQIGELGQYFTSKALVRYCIALCDPALTEDGNIPSMGDFFCGSGGFITEYIRYMMWKEPNLNWNDQIEYIYGVDTDADIIKSARVDCMTLTKTFNNDACVFSENFRNKNTFEDKLYGIRHGRDRVFVDFNFTNPPYGNSGKNDETGKVKISNCNEHVKHVAKTGSINIPFDPLAPCKGKKAVKDAITGDNKECCALLHGMANLAVGGTYCGVLKEGVFFDGKFKDLRKALVENYEVQYVISVPQDEFLNTSTKTSILIFKNSMKKTTEIRFMELEVVKDKDHVTGFNELNPDTKQIINTFLSNNYEFDAKDGSEMVIKYDEIVKNEYTFNYKNYIKQNINAKQGFKVVKLGDILEYLPKSKRKAGDAIENGTNRFYTSSDKIKTCDFLDVKKQLCVIFGTGGNGSLFLDDNFSCSADNFVCKTNDANLTTYIYYYVKQNWEAFIYKLFNGSTLGHINKENLGKYEIPIPDDMSILEDYLSYLGPANKVLQTLQTLQKEKEEEICGKIRVLCHKPEYSTEHRLGDVCQFKDGKYNSKDMTNTGEYPFYNASVDNPKGTHNECCFNNIEQILFVKSGGNSNNKISNSHALGLPIYVKGKCASNVHVSQITLKHNVTSYTYLYYCLQVVRPIIQFNANYSTGLGGVNMEHMKNLQIKILKPEILDKFGLTEDLKTAELIRDQLQTVFKNQEYFTRDMMKLVLDDVQNNGEIYEEDEAETDEVIEEVQPVIEVVVPKEEVKTTVKKPSAKKAKAVVEI